MYSGLIGGEGNWTRGEVVYRFPVEHAPESPLIFFVVRFSLLPRHSVLFTHFEKLSGPGEYGTRVDVNKSANEDSAEIRFMDQIGNRAYDGWSIFSSEIMRFNVLIH